MKTREYPQYNENDVDNIEKQLINRIIVVFVLLGILFLIISGILIVLDNRSYVYWGELSNSIAFEIFGVILMYRFIKYLLRSDLSDTTRDSRIRIGLGLIGIIVAFWIFRGLAEWEINTFINDSLLNLSIEFGGALSLYYLFDQFLELIQKQRQRLNNYNNQKQVEEVENLRKSHQELIYQVAGYEADISKLKVIVHKYMSLENRVWGILSEQEAHSREDILRIINTDLYGDNRHLMKDIQSVLGKLSSEERIFSDRYGKYLKKGRTNEPKNA
jgi:hypothetical protein